MTLITLHRKYDFEHWESDFAIQWALWLGWKVAKGDVIDPPPPPPAPSNYFQFNVVPSISNWTDTLRLFSSQLCALVGRMMSILISLIKTFHVYKNSLNYFSKQNIKWLSKITYYTFIMLRPNPQVWIIHMPDHLQITKAKNTVT